MTTDLLERHPAQPAMELAREAFRMRANQAVNQLVLSASVETLTRALAAATDFGAVASALGHAPLPHAALELDPLADAVARGAAAREDLAARAGGLLSAADAGRVLGISRQAVDKRRRAHQLLAVRVAEDWRYPGAQIGPAGQPPQAWPTILAAGAASGLTGWVMLDFLLAPETALDDRSPLDVLLQGASGGAAVLRLLKAAEADVFG